MDTVISSRVRPPRNILYPSIFSQSFSIWLPFDSHNIVKSVTVDFSSGAEQWEFSIFPLLGSITRIMTCFPCSKEIRKPALKASSAIFDKPCIPTTKTYFFALWYFPWCWWRWWHFFHLRSWKKNWTISCSKGHLGMLSRELLLGKPLKKPVSKKVRGKNLSPLLATTCFHCSNTELISSTREQK